MAMGRPKAVLVLDAELREQLESLANSRSLPAGLVRRAKIILLSASGKTNVEIARQLETSKVTVSLWRCRFLRQGVSGLYDELRPGRPRPRFGAVVVAARFVGRGHVGIDDAEVGDEYVLTRLVPVGQQATTHVAHDVAGRLTEVPLHEHLEEYLGVVATHGDRLAEIPIHVRSPRRCATIRRWISDMPARSKVPADPPSTAPVDFGGTASRSRTSSTGRWATSA